VISWLPFSHRLTGHGLPLASVELSITSTVNTPHTTVDHFNL
jgi:hypothetical protein